MRRPAGYRQCRNAVVDCRKGAALREFGGDPIPEDVGPSHSRARQQARSSMLPADAGLVDMGVHRRRRLADGAAERGWKLAALARTACGPDAMPRACMPRPQKNPENLRFPGFSRS
ncbi:hypothetical protein ACFOPN_09530 [Xanthomonas hyacinthi]|uniref:hypothetical protein n=1 Tax=Xanthomonas hyacinthi TaxID=56455 RepID=UPI0036093057